MAPFGYSILTFAISMIFAGIWQDRRSKIVGLSVMGAGFGPLLYGPLIERLIGKDGRVANHHPARVFHRRRTPRRRHRGHRAIHEVASARLETRRLDAAG